ncbi:MAG: hypothetical protein HRT35_20085 [Algicola sp.]|nr:hypothetical protein [Algicola sp.]
MIRFLFLLPLVLVLIWFAYLRANNWTMSEGKQGFYYILAFSGFVAAFFGMMLYVAG